LNLQQGLLRELMEVKNEVRILEILLEVLVKKNIVERPRKEESILIIILRADNDTLIFIKKRVGSD